MWSSWEIHRSEQEFVASRKKEMLILQAFDTMFMALGNKGMTRDEIESALHDGGAK